MLTGLAKAHARVTGIDRSWSSAAVGPGLGPLTGAAVGAFLTLVVDDGPGFNKIAAAIGGFVPGSTVAATLWTLVDPLRLTTPGRRDPSATDGTGAGRAPRHSRLATTGLPR